MAPHQVSIQKHATISQKISGRTALAVFFFTVIHAYDRILPRPITIAHTPPLLLGHDRSTAYSHKKYHSG